MKNLIIILMSILSITSLFAQTDKRLKGIEKELNTILKATHAPGFAVAIVEGDKVIYAKGFGYRDYENKIPVDANTLFAIGSSTKSFTSAILGKLRADDKLSFNDNPRDYIPELEFYNDDMNNHIIIKDLMRHSTGLPRHDSSWYFFPTHSKDSLIQRIKYQEPFTGIRQQWYYNNFMFLVQGVIAEKITGKSWEDNIKDLFFKPLGMDRSNVGISEMKAASNAAIGYQLKDGDVISKMDYYDFAGMSPIGGINSSVNDMAKWLITWINKGKFNDKEVIPEGYVNEAISSQMVINGALPEDELPNMYFANYGYGWGLTSYRGHYRVEHGGRIDGFTASVCFFPTDKIGIVVLTNQNGSAVTGLARNTIADRMLGEDVTDWTKRYVDVQEKAKKSQGEAQENIDSENIKNPTPSHSNTDYTGSYSNPGYGKFEVFVKNDSLFSYTTDTTKQLYLDHYHYDVFDIIQVENGKIDKLNNELGVKVIFNTNVKGDISEAKLKLDPMLDPIVFKHMPKIFPIDAKTLEQYVGEYEISGNPIKVYIKNKETLYVFIEGQPEYELVATGKHLFSLKDLGNYKVEFNESDDKSINGLTFLQPNGTFKATRK